MPFKVRDLMIDVLPEAAAGGGPNLGCCPGTLITCIQGTCPAYTFNCCPGTRITCFLGTCGYACSFITPPCFNCPVTTCPTATCGWTYPTPPVTPPPEFNQAGMIASPQNLTELKAQLRQALAQVEAQERVAEESMRPQSLEEVDMLEQKLTEALEELRQHKDELRRRTSE